MLKFIIRRLLFVIPVLIFVIFIVFTLSYFMPGDPVTNLLPTSYTQEMYDEKAAELGLDQPYHIQLGNYFWGLITEFDLGTSYDTHRPVSDAIRERIMTTLKVGLLSCLVTVIIGIPVGIISSTNQYSWIDYSVTALTIFFTSAPPFWIALIAIIVFSLHLGWLPASGLASWKCYILPVICNGIQRMAAVARMTRSSMLEVIRQDYIRTAYAKGLEKRRIIHRHALGNALIPIISTVGFQMCQIIAGTVVIESIFSITGIGTLLVTAVNHRDYPMITGITIVVSAFVCIMNLLIDILYSVADPRIKAQFSDSKKRMKARTVRAK